MVYDGDGNIVRSIDFKAEKEYTEYVEPSANPPLPAPRFSARPGPETP